MGDDSPVSFLDVAPPEDWTCCALEELVDNQRGISYGIVQPGRHDVDGVPIVRVNNLRNGRIETDDVLRVSPEVEEKYARTRLRGGEVLLSLVGTLGECAVVPSELAGWNVARAVAVIPIELGVDPKWIVTCLRSSELQHLIRTWATTTVQATLNLRDVRRLPIILPPHELIGWMMELIGALDDKIELNRQMNRTLEAMARAIFKAWFVDFEPIKAKAADATSFRGMPQAVFDQLPNRFTDSEVGLVPEGWERRPLVEVTNYLKRGISPKYIEKGGVCVVNQRCIRHHWIDATQSRRHDAELKSVEGRDLELLDVLVNSTGVGTLGRVAQVLSLPERTIADSHVTVVRANPEEVLPECIGYDLSFRENEIEMLGHGSTGQTELSRIRLGELLIVKAPKPVQVAFARIIRPINGKRVANWAESQTLAAIRDTLLPKLISGEMRVPTAMGGADDG